MRGAVDVKVEQTGGLPVLEIKVDKSAIARRGLSISAVQDVIGAAIGGQEAGVVFEGDRSFDIIVRLPESVRSDLEALGNLPVALPKATPTSAVQSLSLNRVARFSFSEGPNQISRENGKRRIVVTANVRGRDLGSVVEDAQQASRGPCGCRPATGSAWGGQSENLAAARQRLAIVVPACFVMIFLLLLARWARRAMRFWCSARFRWRSPAASLRCGCAACRFRFPPPSASSRCRASPCSTAW